MIITLKVMSAQSALTSRVKSTACVVVEPRRIRASPHIVENTCILENRHTGRLDAYDTGKSQHIGKRIAVSRDG